MKRFVLVFTMIALMSADILAQSERHPISTASLIFQEGRSEITFDEQVCESFIVEVRDLTGKTVFVLQSDPEMSCHTDVELPIANLKRGIYMVLITGASGKTKTLKLQRN
jgi:hypothetical protein